MPERPFIPYGRQDIRPEDIAAVMDVLQSDFLTQGPAIPAFEQAVAQRVEAAHAVASNSATSALHLACMALDLGPGGRLWTSPITFVASANCGRYCGAEVDFVDIDPRTFNLCPNRLEDKLKQADRDGTLPDVLIPVHMCGQSADMAAIGALAQRYGVRVIEDASHAIGATHEGAPVGRCDHSDIAVFSFHPVKIVTSGEGGMCVTQDAELADRMRRQRTHGITRDPQQMRGESHGPWYYEQLELGVNYRMTDIHAALGTSQMARLDTYVDRRNALAERYDALLGPLPVTAPWRHPDTRSSFHLYVIQLDRTQAIPHRRAVFEALRAGGIGVNVHYIPVHLQPDFRDLGFNEGDFPLAEAYYREAISLPLYPGLTEADQDRVVATLRSALERA